MIRHLFVPGLLGPLPGPGHAALPPLPNLERLLARADRHTGPVGYAAGLCDLFGIEPPAGTGLPTAALRYLGDTGEAPPGYLMSADALQLVPDRDCLLAFDLDDDPLDGDEIDHLLTAFDRHFGDDGLRLLSGPAGRLYLHCETTPSVRMHPVASVVGRNVDRFLPEGEERRWWRSVLNETQMLCHALPFNHEREARGRQALGGLWFSGGGHLPARGRGPVARLIGNCTLARGLLALRPAASGDELIVEAALDRAVVRADPDAWLGALTELEGRLPALSRDCEALHVHPGTGTIYRWHPGSARRWWRRRRPLATYLEPNPAAARGPDAERL